MRAGRITREMIMIMEPCAQHVLGALAAHTGMRRPCSTATGAAPRAARAQAPLAALYQAIDGRVSLYQQLLRLHGRLGLITAHSRAGGHAGAEEGGGALAPEVVFEDASGEEEPEAEDPFAQGESSEGSSGSEGGSGSEEDDDLMGDEEDEGDDDEED